MAGVRIKRDAAPGVLSRGLVLSPMLDFSEYPVTACSPGGLVSEGFCPKASPRVAASHDGRFGRRLQVQDGGISRVKVW